MCYLFISEDGTKYKKQTTMGREEKERAAKATQTPANVPTRNTLLVVSV